PSPVPPSSAAYRRLSSPAPTTAKDGSSGSRWNEVLARKLSVGRDGQIKAHDLPAGSAMVRGRPYRRTEMKIISISIRGVRPVAATKTKAKDGAEYYVLTHGQNGRGRWQIRLPLAAREFPAPADGGDKFLLDGQYKLVDLRK